MKDGHPLSTIAILRKLLGFLVMVSLASASVARAQVVEYEGFDYTGAALADQSGGIGWGTNVWADSDADAPLADDGASLSFPSSVGHTPVGRRIAFTAAGEAERRLGTSLPLNVTGNAYFFSALVKRQGDFRFEFIDSGTNVRWRFGGGDPALKAAVLGVGSDTNVNDIFPADETVLVVAKLLTHATANDQVYLNVYRAGDIVPTSEPNVWQASGGSASGVTLVRLQIRNISDLPLEIDEIRIGATFQDVAGGVASGPPTILRHPSSASLYAGQNVQFSVDAAGQDPLSFQWQLNGNPVANATNSILSLTNIQPNQSGAYVALVTNAAGSAQSNPAQLNVIALTNVTVGMQALWRFDETNGLTAADATGHGHEGLLGNFPDESSHWAPGQVNGGLNFNGSDYVEVVDDPGIGSGLVNQFSVAAWLRSNVRLSTNGNTYRMLEKEASIFLLQGDGNTNGLGIGGMNLLVKKATANVSVAIGEALEANVWYHLAATFDGSMLRIYLNGDLKGTRAVAAPIDSTTMPLRIGSDYNPAGSGIKFFNGTLDEVGLWDRPLSLDEILKLAGRSGPPSIVDQPESVTKYPGSTATFTVIARGSEPMRYLWFKGTNELRSATEPTLRLLNIQAEDAGQYRCRITNPEGEIFTDAVTLTVTPVLSIDDGMQAHWKFDETNGLTAADASGLGRLGDLVDYVDGSQWVTGRVNGALSFDGAANRVVASSSAPLDVGTDASFAFWIRPTSYGTLETLPNYTRNISRIVRKGTQFDIVAIDDPGSVRATITANGVGAPQYSLKLNEWQHWVVVFQGGTVRFYQNGFLLAQPSAANLGAANTNLVVLGNLNEVLTTPTLFSGDMDEVQIWARPLTDAEILTVAGRDVAGAPALVSTPESATRYAGGTVELKVDATGKLPLTYTWMRDGVALANSNTNRLVLQNLTSADAGSYTVKVENSLGSVTSSTPVALTIKQIADVTTGLVAHWTFDETSGEALADATGRGHNAVLQNASAIPGIPGVVGGAFDFDGVDDFAIVPHASDLNLLDQASISVWINPRTFGVSGSGGYGRIVKKDVNYDLTVYSAGNTLRLFGVNKTPYDTPAGTVVTNEWQHFAVVLKEGTVQFFKNGRAVADPIPGSLGSAVTNDLVIGNFGPDLAINRIFNGYMDELGIWERALSAAEVDGIYQNGVLGKGLNATFEPLRIQQLQFPGADQLRLVFFSPFVGREFVIEWKDQVEAAWTNQPNVTFKPLGAGVMEAAFSSPMAAARFYRVAVLPKPPIFSDNFETGAAGWTHGGTGDLWQLGTPVNGPGAAFSGTNVYATSLAGNIEAFSDNYLRSPSIDLTGVNRATLTFEQWLNLDPTFHGAIVNVLDATTLDVLQQLSQESGSITAYQAKRLPLPPSVLGRKIVLEFRIFSDEFNLLEGWYIDDVKLLPE